MYPHLLRTRSRLQQHHVHANLRRSHGHLIARFLTLPRLHLATPVQTLASVVSCQNMFDFISFCNHMHVNYSLGIIGQRVND